MCNVRIPAERTKKLTVNRDVRFDEETSWNWNEETSWNWNEEKVEKRSIIHPRMQKKKTALQYIKEAAKGTDSDTSDSSPISL